MPNITLENIAELLRDELKPINTRLTTIEETLAQHTKTLDIHTKALDTLLSKKKTKEEEKIISADRFDRLEQWASLVGKKLGIKLEL
jgi:septal ring factor EnvC (AmiA/AmiB activator)